MGPWAGRTRSPTERQECPPLPPLCTRLPQQYFVLLVAHRFMDKTPVFASLFFSSIPPSCRVEGKLPCFTKCFFEYRHMEFDLSFFTPAIWFTLEAQ